jgi:hypothetical protein
MGQARHKLAGSYISLNTREIPAARLLEMCELAATQAMKRRGDKPSPVVITARAPASMEFAVLNPFKKAIMRFRVVTRRADAGSTDLVSEITWFMTKQDTILFIPAGPKKLVAWNYYLTFMECVQAAIREADPNADIEIVNAAAG